MSWKVTSHEASPIRKGKEAQVTCLIVRLLWNSFIYLLRNIEDSNQIYMPYIKNIIYIICQNLLTSWGASNFFLWRSMTLPCKSPRLKPMGCKQLAHIGTQFFVSFEDFYVSSEDNPCEQESNSVIWKSKAPSLKGCRAICLDKVFIN